MANLGGALSGLLLLLLPISPFVFVFGLLSAIREVIRGGKTTFCMDL